MSVCYYKKLHNGNHTAREQKDKKVRRHFHFLLIVLAVLCILLYVGLSHLDQVGTQTGVSQGIFHIICNHQGYTVLLNVSLGKPKLSVKETEYLCRTHTYAQEHITLQPHDNKFKTSILENVYHFSLQSSENYGSIFLHKLCDTGKPTNHIMTPIYTLQTLFVGYNVQLLLYLLSYTHCEMFEHIST